ncbi:MAG: DNA polymerase III subunit gamma/tau [Eubacteriales bacterium]
MEYIALYRKYRPKSFSEIIGQDNIVTILRNQITMNKIAHAYLFCGTRGTGKTSAAKIFAKAVNCPMHPEGNPCNYCEICKNIEHNQIMDIIEIDAASNRGVDEIRELREKVKYPPTLGTYKVYIIDEVHMLTQEAFNALLKTLEEPPHHVIFILATTEPHKIPATILSRCQRFNFKRIQLADLIESMKYICKEQDIEVDEKALTLIAKNADGAMRDALSILEQCLSVNIEGQVHYEQVEELLGLSHESIIFDLAEKILQRNVKSALEILEFTYENGNEMGQLMDQLILCFRDILVYHISKECKHHYDLSEDHVQRLMKIGEGVPKERLTYDIEILTEMENKMKYSTLPKIMMEVAIIKLCQIEEEIQYASIKKPFTKQGVVKEKQEIYKYHGIEEKSEVIQDKKIDKKEKVKTGQIDINWSTVCKNISKEKPLLASALQMGQVKEITEDKICITFSENDSIHLISANKNQSFIGEMINKMYKKELFIQFSIEEKKDKDGFIQFTKTLFGDDKVTIIED